MKDSAKVTQLDFSGQSIYIGLDVHKLSWTVTILVGEISHKTYTQPPDAMVLYNYLQRNFPGADYYSAYEAGFSGFWAHKQLKKLGVHNQVVHAADVPTTDKERRQKTDKRDSRKIARSLREGSLVAIHVHTDRNLEARQLVRFRHKLVRDLTRSRNYLLMSLHSHGTIIPENLCGKQVKWTRAFVKWLSEQEMAFDSGKSAMKLAINRMEMAKQQVLEANRELGKLAGDDHYKPQFELLKSIPGIGLINAMVFLTELENINRFKKPDHLCSYVGLIPSTHASGEKQYNGKMTNRGNKFLKTAIIESAWVAMRCDPAMIASYIELKKRMPANKAIIRIARKLLNRIQYVLKNQVLYQSGKVN